MAMMKIMKNKIKLFVVLSLFAPKSVKKFKSISRCILDFGNKWVLIDFVFKDGTNRFLFSAFGSFCCYFLDQYSKENELIWFSEKKKKKELFGCKNKGNSDEFIVQNSKRRSIT